MRMDTNPGVSLSVLYKNDPFYSLCLSDLMTASQSVKNQVLNEQRNLTKTLKNLEYQQLCRMRQLNEEKKQFAFLMKKKLAPRASRLSTFTVDKPFRRVYSNASFSALTSATSSVKSYETGISSKATSQAQSISTTKSQISSEPKAKHVKVTRSCYTATVPKKKCECVQSSKLSTRSISCFPEL